MFACVLFVIWGVCRSAHASPLCICGNLDRLANIAAHHNKVVAVYVYDRVLSHLCITSHHDEQSGMAVVHIYVLDVSQQRGR